MGELIDVQQDSEAWHKERAKGLGSSDAPVLLCVSPWKSLCELWREKKTGVSEVVQNYAMQRGKDLEPIARDIYEFEYSIQMQPKYFKHKRFDFIRGSFDGFNEAARFGLEIKSPMSKKEIEKAKQGIITTKYVPQLEWLMLVSSTTFIDYATYDGQDQLYVKRYFYNERLRKALLVRARWFWWKIKNNKEITKQEENKCLELTKKLFTDLGLSIKD